MKFYHFLWLLLFLCQGCLAYLSKDLRQVACPQGQNGTENISLSLKYQTPYPPKDKGKVFSSWKKTVFKTYQESHYFSTVIDSLADTKQAEVKIQLYPLKHKGVKIVWFFVSSLSLYTIPVYIKPEIGLETVFRDKSGNVLGKIEKKGKMSSWTHILLLPAVPFADTDKVIRKAIEKLTLQTLQEAREKGFI